MTLNVFPEGLAWGAKFSVALTLEATGCGKRDAKLL